MVFLQPCLALTRSLESMELISGGIVTLSLSEKAAQALEWPKLLEFLAARARSTTGAARCRDLALADTVDDARARQSETTDMRKLVEGADPFPATAFPDIREQVMRASKGGVLEAPELRDCAQVMTAVDELARFLVGRRHHASALWEAVEPLHGMAGLPPVRRAIEAAIQPDGSMHEAATPELRRLTHHAQELKQEMRQRLEHLIHSRRYEDVLQESYFAEREGRYVLPVKSEMRAKMPGIVHDVSASGATVFVEPRELVELNNSIKVADLEIEREIRRILRELTVRVAAEADALLVGVDILSEIDCIHAKALLSRDLKAEPVSLNDRGRVVLKQARHPILVMMKPHVVANDIVLDEAISVLVISGPNTGGKTVTLKIVGLFALMVRAGLHVPCAPESDMALFTRLYADIGEAQDLSRDLSSFSAHITQIVRLLSEATMQANEIEPERVQALVLLDEPVTSTDPREGAALAEALLRRLAAMTMKVVVTTHYGGLKVLAQTTPGFANASVEFDVSRLAPTYRLFMGIPGGSSALDIAARLGMDEDLIDDARARLAQDDRRLDAVMADLQAKQRELANDAEEARQARVAAQQAAREAEALRTELEERERDARKGMKKKLGEEFQRARAEVQATMDSFKRDQRLLKAKETKQRLAELEQQASSQLAPPQPTVPVEQLGAGSRVEISSLGMTGILLEPPQGKKRVRVKVGEGEVVATVANLVGLPAADGEGIRPSTVPSGYRRSAHTSDIAEQTEVDVRGQAADEAVEQVIAALDRATLSGAPYLRIIHGHGTGRLKAALRDYLRESPYVEHFRPGDRAEGGDGVTIAKLR